MKTVNNSATKSTVWGKVPEGSTLTFKDTQNFLTTQQDGSIKTPMPKTSPICLAVSIEHRIWRTDTGP